MRVGRTEPQDSVSSSERKFEMNHGTSPHIHQSKRLKATTRGHDHGSPQQVGPKVLEIDADEAQRPDPFQSAIPELLTTRELAQILRFETQTIRKKKMNDTLGIKPITIGRRHLWRKADLLDLLRRLQHQR